MAQKVKNLQKIAIVQKCNRTSHAQKSATRKHIARTFQNAFCTRAIAHRTFETHPLQKKPFFLTLQ